ncbi:MAG: T9SS type A sorting domain-containing protein, partial [Bacteroidota bacterium]
DQLCEEKSKNLKRPGIQDQEIMVFPNPAAQQLNISSGEMAMVRLQLLDLLGRIVYLSEFPLKHKVTQQSINVEPLSKGFYSLVLELADGSTVTRKVTIQ